MRFLRLDLRAFGPFTDPPPLELGGGDRGLHLILGPNEAGKSTALRAIRHLLFGFPARSPDDHAHKYDRLRVGAAIRDEAGGELGFVRRKRDVKSLWTFDDAEALPPDALAPFLAGVDAARFDDLFAMDHAELVAGGRAIVEGKGSLGSILFAAGSGLTQVDDVRRAIDAEIDGLFKPAGKNPAINRALDDLKAARQESEAAMLATSSWVEVDATLARERSRKDAVDAEIRRDGADKRRLERARDALPVIARLDAATARLDGLAGTPALSPGFSERRREAIVDRQAATRAGLAAEGALDRVEGDIDALGPRDPALDEADAIRRVRDDLGLYRKAVEARPVDRARLDRLRADARALLLGLRPGASVDDEGTHRVPPGLEARLQELARERARLDADVDAAEAEVADLVAESPGAVREASPAPMPPDAPRLARALDEAVGRARALGDFEGQLESARGELDRLDRQAAVDLRGLPLWSGSLDDLEVMAAPSAATLDRFEARARAADEAVGRLEAELARVEAEGADLAREIDRDRGAGAVPSEDELAGRRARRDDAWRLVRRAWLDREPVEAPGRLADDLEAALRDADDTADRLRREADAVALQAQRRWRRRELLDGAAAVSSALDRARGDGDEVRREWLALWSPLGLDPLPPREMKDWVAIRRADLVRQARALRDRRLDLDEKASRVVAIKEELGRHLDGLGEPPAGPSEPLAALLSRARAAVDRVGLALKLDAARAGLARAGALLGAWEARWASALGPLGLTGDASPSEALAVVDRFEELARLLREVDDLRDRVEERARFEARFEAEVGALAARLGGGRPDDPGASIGATARDLDSRLGSALVAEARREEALKRRSDERSKLEDARAAVDRADLALSGLVAEAGCGSVDGLVEAERASDEVLALKAEVRALEGQLDTLAGPVGAARLREEARGVDPETLELRIAELADRLAPLELERDRLGEEIGRCRQKLDAMDGGPAAADAQQAVEERVARLASDVEKYARLRLASAVLRDAVEAHRKKHQGPVLDRAGDLFRRLTAGSFAGLRAEVDDKAQPILLGLRADGVTALPVDAMSEGTADQLYLALRLASLHAHLDDHEPIPLVVDDLLVNFDNARALAALGALAELSGRTQVLFFTHHEHLAELARSHLPAGVLFVHHLGHPPAPNGQARGPALEASRPKRKQKATPSGGDER